MQVTELAAAGTRKKIPFLDENIRRRGEVSGALKKKIFPVWFLKSLSPHGIQLMLMVSQILSSIPCQSISYVFDFYLDSVALADDDLTE